MSFRALRPALRAARAPRVPAARSGPVRFASSAPQQAADAAKDAAGKAQHAAEKVKHAAKGSDAPWAIGSLLVFLPLGVYLTAPPSKKAGGHGHDDHGHGAGHGERKGTGKPRVDDATAGSDFEDVAQGKTESRDLHEDAPEGNKALAAQSHGAEDEAASLQKVTKEPSRKSRGDSSTFQAGIAAAKEGHKGGEDSHVSDPKKVVAAAKTAQQDAQQQKSAKKEEKKDEEEKSESDDEE